MKSLLRSVITQITNPALITSLKIFTWKRSSSCELPKNSFCAYSSGELPQLALFCDSWCFYRLLWPHPSHSSVYRGTCLVYVNKMVT